MTSFWQNLRDLPASLSLSGLMAGLLVVVTGYSGPILLVLAAAQAGNFTDAQTASWIMSCAIGNGILTILQSLYYRQPITAPWSTAGLALLTTTLPNITVEQAVGAYIVCAVMIALIGVSGLFGRAMALVPLPVVAGLIAGILLNFGRGVYAAIGTANDPVLVFAVFAMIGIFFLLKRFGFRAPTLGALLLGATIAILAGKTDFSEVRLEVVTPLLFAPDFDLNVILTLALPSVALSLTSQYAPGQAVLRTSGYTPPINAILRNTGIGSVIIAFFGGHGATLGALTAAIVASPESQPDPDKRYASAVASGFFYIVFGLFGTTIFALFAGLPKVLVDVVAGLALMGTIVSNLAIATADTDGRDAGIAAFLCTASGMTFLGIAAPFWGLVLGIAVYAILKRNR